jgi:hypothetical protein
MFEVLLNVFLRNEKALEYLGLDLSHYFVYQCIAAVYK